MSYSIRRSITNEEQLKLASFSPLLSHLLFHRDLQDTESAHAFISPDYDLHVHDPFLLKDAERSAERILRAIKSDERITIYSDYDADGIPGAVIWHDFFTRIGYTHFSIYIPHRHNEGFGLNRGAIDKLASEGVKLLITLDCGITDVEPVAYAVSKGMEVIITDHHEPPELLPPAFAIVNHKQKECTYPDKNLCGSAVAFKLIQAIIKKDRELRDRSYDLLADRGGVGKKVPAEKSVSSYKSIFPDTWKEGHEKWLLDMVGIATLSDMVSLKEENRALAYFGLNVLRQSPRKGLIRLLEKLKIPQKHLTEDDIAFMVTPRINAASRMGLPMDAFSLLAAQTDEDARTYADHLDDINQQRKTIVATLSKEIKKILHERYGSISTQDTDTQDASSSNSKLPSVIVLGNPDWRPSLLGLVANTCAQQYDRPVFLWGRDGDGGIKGSCRSEGVSSVVDIMRGTPEGTFIKYGGHTHSGGFEVSKDQVHFLDTHLNDSSTSLKLHRASQENIQDTEMLSFFAKKVAQPEDIENGHGQDNSKQDGNIIDMELTIDEVSWNLYNDIAKLAPFGMDNSKPVFMFRKIIPSGIKIFGKTKDHVEVSFQRSNGQKIPAISFFGAGERWVQKVVVGTPLDLIASVEKSLFAGRTELRLRIVDVLN
jgi:single-stranded-DNA-specific exonuclease